MVEIIKDTPSPNFNDRPQGLPIDMLVLHYTGMRSAEAALSRLCDPEAEVSSHYLIDEEGTVFRLVPEKKRAWHAGISYWRGRENINHYSIGIELVNPGHALGYRPFPEAQMAALTILAQNILTRHPIPPQHVIAHSDIAPERKEDPGELFDWARLASSGIGLWVPKDSLDIIDENIKSISEVQKALKAFGYNAPLTGQMDDATAKIITAFRRHFIPWNLCASWDAEAQTILDRLLAITGK